MLRGVEGKLDGHERAAGRSTGLLRVYERIMGALAGTMMAAIVVIMVVQVVARYVFGSSLIWAEELCRYILIWMTFLLLGLAYQKGEFVALDLLPGAMPEGARRALRVIVALPVLFFLGLMAWMGWSYAARFDNQTIPALDFIWESLTGGPLQLSIRWVYVSVAVGSFLLALHILVDAVLTLKRLVTGGPEARQAQTSSGEHA